MIQNKPSARRGSWQLDGGITNKAADASSLKCWDFFNQRYLNLILQKMKLNLFITSMDQFKNKTRHELLIFSSGVFGQTEQLDLGFA